MELKLLSSFLSYLINYWLTYLSEFSLEPFWINLQAEYITYIYQVVVFAILSCPFLYNIILYVLYVDVN